MPHHSGTGPRRVLKHLTTVGLTLTVFAGATASVIAGVRMISGGAAPVTTAMAPRTPVGVLQIRPESGYTVTRRFTGQVEAAARTDLAFELGGRITEVLVEEGATVPAGALLARLDTSALVPQRAALEAELSALAADAELARLTLERNDALTEQGFRSVAAQDDARLALTRTEARMAAVRAQVAGIDVQLDKSELRAPFAARVGARRADPGQTVAGGQTALVLFAAAPPRLRVGLPPELAATLRAGDVLSVEIEGDARPARVLHLRPDLDAATRSRSVVLALTEESTPVLGDTADLILDQRVADLGFWAPLAALREGVRGSWSVMAIESAPEGDRTVPVAVEVLHVDGSRVFLRGVLPAGARIVADAPDRVAPGQLVIASRD